jgi:hypothetical protein
MFYLPLIIKILQRNYNNCNFVARFFENLIQIIIIQTSCNISSLGNITGSLDYYFIILTVPSLRGAAFG